MDSLRSRAMAVKVSPLPSKVAATMLLEQMIDIGKQYLGKGGHYLQDYHVTSADLDVFYPTNWYSARTFHLLRATSSIPLSWTVYISDERIQITSATQNILSVCHKDSNHWLLIHVHIASRRMTYYDSKEGDGGRADLSVCLCLSDKIRSALNKIGRGDEWSEHDFVHPCSLRLCRTISQNDSSSCGPLAWREAELLLYHQIPKESREDLRYRQCKQIVDAVIENSRPYTSTKSQVNERREIAVESGSETCSLPEIVDEGPVQSVTEERLLSLSKVEEYLKKNPLLNSEAAASKQNLKRSRSRDSQIMRPHQRWTTEETEKVLALYRDGMMYEEIATKMDRTHGSIRVHLWRLNKDLEQSMFMT